MTQPVPFFTAVRQADPSAPVPNHMTQIALAPYSSANDRKKDVERQRCATTRQRFRKMENAVLYRQK
jgi:hypothetical protein